MTCWVQRIYVIWYLHRCVVGTVSFIQVFLARGTIVTRSSIWHCIIQFADSGMCTSARARGQPDLQSFISSRNRYRVSVQPQPLWAVTHLTALLIFNYYFVITWYTKDTHSSFIRVYFFISQMCSSNFWKSLSCGIRPTLRTTKTF